MTSLFECVFLYFCVKNVFLWNNVDKLENSSWFLVCVFVVLTWQSKKLSVLFVFKKIKKKCTVCKLRKFGNQTPFLSWLKVGQMNSLTQGQRRFSCDSAGFSRDWNFENLGKIFTLLNTLKNTLLLRRIYAKDIRNIKI